MRAKMISISKPMRLMIPLLLNLLTLKIFLNGPTLQNLYSIDSISVLQTILTEEQPQRQEDGMVRITREPPPVAVFYNLYTAQKNPKGMQKEILRVAALVREQLAPLEGNKHTFNPLFIKSIGAIKSPADLLLFQNATTSPDIEFLHFDQGSEALSLQHLWDYCRNNQTHPDQVITYLHSKGSFHDHLANRKLRSYNTRGALSSDCTTMPKQQCNICSTRMSPLPHPHTSGNMWTARCDYIAKLYPPQAFQAKMDGSPQRTDLPPWWVGRERFALEHWVHSHPDVQPCDVDSSSRYMWGYPKVPTRFMIQLAPAPRFPWDAYAKPSEEWHYVGRKEERIAEYQYLYNITIPPPTWYGWNLFQGIPETYLWNRTFGIQNVTT